MINIKGIDKATLLAALVNAAPALGMGRLQDDGKPLTRDEAEELWIKPLRAQVSRLMLGDHPRMRFDYVKGRPIKCDIGGDEFDPWLYDRDQGEGAAARVVARLQASETPDGGEVG